MARRKSGAKRKQTRQAFLDVLCFDDPGSPYPLDCLYDLEGLSYVELKQLVSDNKAGRPRRAFSRGGKRRQLAQALGADEDQARCIAQQAGRQLEHLVRVAAQAGVPLQKRGDLLRVATHLLAGLLANPNVFPQEYDGISPVCEAVTAALLLIGKVDSAIQAHVRQDVPSD